MNFFGNAKAADPKKESKDPVVQAKNWKRQLQREINKLDRDKVKLQKAEDKAAKECKKLAQGGNIKAAKIMAREIVNTRKQIERMYTTQAQLGSVQMTLSTSISMMKVQGIMGKSVEIMQAMNQLINLPELRKSMSEMAREMEKAGLIDEMIGDTFDSMDSEGIDDAADAEVDKVVKELTEGLFEGATAAPTSNIKVPQPVAVPAAAVPAMPDAPGEEMNETDMQAMRARLQAL